ncbi:MerR family transcriptional regulator [Tabrizicola aquatica]|uniref:MerR family transcriptional regulator n=1 Tax=Tabrizicola aquatica TaxID=909926 RepID=UPI000CD328CF|nr:MerR family transcriptional regulator [Tabrizicola aquatica]
MDKSPDAFRTISEVAEHLETPAHVLRFWESRFPQIRPVKRAGGRRYYRPSDVALLAGIKRLLHDEGLTIRGVQKILRDQGVRHVAGLSDDSVPVDLPDGLPEPADLPPLVPGEAVPEAAFIAIEDEEETAPPPTAPQVQAPAAPAPVQAVLPLFDLPIAQPVPTQPAPVQPAEADPAPKPRPILRNDVTFASRIRALPPKALSDAMPEVSALARRLAALRARLGDRAEGGTA